MDDDYMVQDWRGMVMSQEDHRYSYGFPGYPATHDIDCTCEHCTTATLNCADYGGYVNLRYEYAVTRRVIFGFLNERPQFEFLNDRPWIKEEEDFSPKKEIKSHKLVERKYTMRRPGVYTREVDCSAMFIPNREEFTSIFGQPE